MTEKSKEIIIYKSVDGISQLSIKLDNEDVWLTQKQLTELYQAAKSTVSEHIKNIYADDELSMEATVREIRTVQKEGNREVARNLDYYNLDMVIALGYRINSKIATHFRQWATQRLKEYIIKGFTMDDDRLKNLGGGNYWKELLNRIRDIRSSEKVMYRQVLDLYATAKDYNSNSKESITFFKIVQNKLHFAAHGNTASEVVFFRVDNHKPFAGLTNFKGTEPTQAEAMVAKNFLEEKELKVLNNLVAAYFDLAELNAIEEREMYMKDYVKELDKILSSAGRKILENAGSVSSKQAKEKAKKEYKKYKAKTLSAVEQEYLKTVLTLEKKAKKESRKKN
ncbi:RhuM family protein [Tenacibaculum finnmarkense]|uniref:RhuM family protein n=1 Tax=Tenacibaculum finnmarkense TaxID=2781243 RepID=UPI000739255E|nr:RhuM family protein [Tenacibaculum finnmarkense]ALU75381.1 cell filamentation protein Fic [Tenacibaculum dicentrarchi]MBE7632783.1 cell filamentation protein Fic [Tenacibaculum finnmarkense genomovar ulcerans]MBE7644433.1 cell filamentation protein Fic [Tenacibaculum finnmarkense genomovar ulcerans]MBE7648025.1 cell filamentation protein Fic [Tenacibaculum finnmarkense genomovar ulcerans]MCD8409930.1 virulence RhuM family protein [Tenacibaculum finnmarkense genomovar ulcerans]